MPNSNYTFISGDSITVGNHGASDFLYHSGDPVPNQGKSDYVLESGMGLGGGPVVMEGVEVGYYESSETTEEFYNFKGNFKNDGSSTYHANGLEDDGLYDRTSSDVIYFLVHHSTASDEWSLGFWTPGATGDHQEGLDFFFHSFGEPAKNPGDPIVKDDTGTADHNEWGTDSNGDPYCKTGWSWQPADGGMWQFTPSSFSITVEMVEETIDAWGPPDPRKAPDILRGIGPKDSVQKDWGGFGSTFDIDINV